MALGVTFVVISGNLDLSVGSMMSFSTIVVLDLHDKIGPALAIPAMFAMTLSWGDHRVPDRLSQAQLADRHAGHAVGHPRTDADLFRRQNMDIANKERDLVRRLRAAAGAGYPGADPDLRRCLAAVLGIMLAKDTLRAKGLRRGRQRHGGHLLGHSARAGGLHLTYMISPFASPRPA
jgi:ribose transport system permease protein